MDIAVFGVGRIGQVHISHLVHEEKVNIKYLVDIEVVHGKIQEVIQKYRLSNVNVLSPGTSDSAINDDSVKAIFICTPVGQKVELIKKSLKSGKHVFCEKPISLIKEEVEECYMMAAECGLALQCGFDKRFDPSVRKLYEQIKQGELGELRMIKLTARELPGLTWKEYILSSGGIFMDTVIHEIDLMCWLAGERPCTLTSFGHAHNKLFDECGDVDGAVILLKFPSGLMGFIENFRGVPYGYDQRFEVFYGSKVLGSDGMMVVTNPKVDHTEKWTKDGIQESPIWQNGLSRYMDGYKAEVRHFLDVVNGTCPCAIKREAVVLVHFLAECAAKSMKEGRVITVPDEVMDS